VPLRIEEILPSGDMAYYMSATHWLDALTPPLESHLQRLCQTVSSIVETRPRDSLRNERVVPREMPQQADGRFRRSIVIGGWAAVVVAVGVLLTVMMFPKESQRDLGTPTKTAVSGSERGSSEKLSSITSTVRAPTQVDNRMLNKSASRSQTPPTRAPQATVDPFAGTQASQPRDDNILKTKLVWIQPGEFTMGSPKDEKDRRKDEDQVHVTLTKGFWLGQHEVTQSEWQHVMQTTPWRSANNVKEGNDIPATYVSWDDAMKFCETLTNQEHIASRLPQGWKYTLPTEAQWEYAGRAGAKSRFSFGDDESELGNNAWFAKNAKDAGEAYAHSVGQKRPNSWGLNDIHGNVWEWCSNCYVKELSGGTDPNETSGSPNRVLRGGSWTAMASNCRLAYRGWRTPDNRADWLGFRVAAVPTGN
jgi:formylglycine-generating enzyme required for sulfatase activity